MIYSDQAVAIEEEDNEDYGLIDDVDPSLLEKLEAEAFQASQIHSEAATRQRQQQLGYEVVTKKGLDNDMTNRANSPEKIILRRGADTTDIPQKSVTPYQSGEMSPHKESENDNIRQPMSKQVLSLMRENGQLKQSYDALIEQYHTARGEVVVLRNRIRTIEQSHLDAIEGIQKTHSGEHERLISNISELRHKIDSLKAEKIFMQRDLKEITDKLRVHERARKELLTQGNVEMRANGSPSPKRSKKQDRSVDLRDGFNTHMSPIRLGKRKRPIPDVDSSDEESLRLKSRQQIQNELSSHGAQLTSLSLANCDMEDNSIHVGSENSQAVDTIPKSSDNKFEFVEYMLHYMNECSESERSRLYFFKFFDAVKDSYLGLSEMINSSVLSLIDIWTQLISSRSFDESIYTLLDILYYAVSFEPDLLSVETLQRISVASQETLVLMLQEKSVLFSTDWQASAMLSLFEILQIISAGIQKNITLAIQLWQTVMTEDFILRFLSSYRMSPRLSIVFNFHTVRLVSNSVLANSFGPVVSDRDRQSDSEFRLIDYICRLLFDESSNAYYQPYSESLEENINHYDFDQFEYEQERLRVQAEAIEFLMVLVHNEHGYARLSRHAKASARIICFVSSQLDKLYSGFSIDNMRLNLIRNSVKLLHSIWFRTDNPSEDDSKKCVISSEDCVAALRLFGAQQEFIVCMTRIAFAEGGAFHDSFDDITVDRAQRLLEIGRTVDELNLFYIAVNIYDNTNNS
ncbi:hypothetical protein V1511DRAFT_505214 [Dipodascopsis uninucleata]